jgi:ATP-dependent Clp protease, protease subunit
MEYKMISGVLLSCLLAGTMPGQTVSVEGGGTMLEDKEIKPPVVLHVSTIDESSATEFVVGMDAAQKTGQTVVPVFISSFGGSVYALIEMIDAIKRSKIPVATIVTGKAMSAGAVLFAMGSPGMRYASPNATIMIHEVSSGAIGKVGDMEGDVAEALRLNTLMFKLMADNIGKPADFFQKIMASKGRVDWFLTVDEAIGLGLINKVGVPEFKVKVKVQTTLE